MADLVAGSLMEKVLDFAWKTGTTVNLFTSASNKLEGVVDSYDENSVLLTKYEREEDGYVKTRRKTTVLDRYHLVSVGLHPNDVENFYKWIGQQPRQEDSVQE